MSTVTALQICATDQTTERTVFFSLYGTYRQFLTEDRQTSTLPKRKLESSSSFLIQQLTDRCHNTTTFPTTISTLRDTERQYVKISTGRINCVCFCSCSTYEKRTTKPNEKKSVVFLIIGLYFTYGTYYV